MGRAYDVKRSSLVGWSPKWLSGRLECAIGWGGAKTEIDSTIARLDGSFTDTGHLHAMAFWLEDHSILDPLLLPVVGIYTPPEVHVTNLGEMIPCTFHGIDPSSVHCSLSVSSG